MKNILLQGDCLEVMKTLPENSVDSIVTDPPYGLSFMGKKWDYDVPSVEIWQECLRVLKPGGHLLSFAGSRTYHRMAVNIEDAGFEIRDQIMWVYGSGFPKSYNIGKNLDKYLRTGNASWNGTGDSSNGALGYTKLQHKQGYRPNDYSNKHQNKEDITEERAKPYEGWGTALKPAHEPIVVARKPLSEKTIAENVLEWGTGGINIDGCRVEYTDGTTAEQIKRKYTGNNEGNDSVTNNFGVKDIKMTSDSTLIGRFPANFIHSGLEEEWARYFYCAKASKKDRNEGLDDFEEKVMQVDGENKNQAGFNSSDRKPMLPRANFHPTVKPTSLMQYLVRLVTPKGGTVLDPFMGSGSTGKACKLEGFNFTGIEMDEKYIKIAEARINNI